MNDRQAQLVVHAREILEKTEERTAATVLWKYECPDTHKDFYLPSKMTTIKSPYSGKSFTSKPERFSMSDVTEELKSDAKESKGKKKSAAEDPLAWKTQG